MKTKLLTGALLVASLAPAAAQAQNWDNNRDHREWRDQRREDRRDDWRAWRDRHPDTYRRGAWSAPFRYRPFGVGMIVPPDYRAPRYAVNNWEFYRLPRPAYGFYRYVRHYDDVLLIDARNGRVIQAYRGFYR